MTNGTLIITLQDAVWRQSAPDAKHDLVIEIKRRDNIWDREAIGEALTFNQSLHEFAVVSLESGQLVPPKPCAKADAREPLSIRLAGSIKPDPWVIAGGKIEVEMKLTPNNTGWTGRYEGTLAGMPTSGAVHAGFADKPRPSLGRASTELAILKRFEQEGAASPLYDFTGAGYRYGEEPPQDVDLPVFRIEDFGAEPDSGKEAFHGIQAAIDAAAEAGGGVVLLPPGIFDISVDEKLHPLKISASNVILRGSGPGPNGTVIVNHRYSDSPDPDRFWLAGQWPMVKAEGKGQATDSKGHAVVKAERGSSELLVADPAPLLPGKPYLFRILENADGTLAKALVQGACEPAANYRGAGKPLVMQLVEIAGVSNDRVMVDAPLHWTLKPEWQADLVPVDMLTGIGIEHIRFRTHWDGYFTHHRTVEDDNGWDHIGLYWVQHSWARDLVHENATTAVGMANCKNCTITDCSIVGNRGHNGFCIGQSCTANLHRRLDCGCAMHAVNMAGTVCGNVILDCQMDEAAGLDLHGGVGLDNLVDCLSGGVNAGGGSNSAVPPRHSQGLVLWNWSMGRYHPYKPWLRRERLTIWHETPGFIAVGVHGRDGHLVSYDGPDGPAHEDVRAPWGWVESNNQAVHPRSLYEWQRRR